MSEHARRTRRGRDSKGDAAPPLRFITIAHKVAGNQITATYNEPQSAAAFSGGNFQSFPSGRITGPYIQVSPTVVRMQFSGSIAGDTNVVYGGSAAGVLTPQTVPYT